LFSLVNISFITSKPITAYLEIDEVGLISVITFLFFPEKRHSRIEHRGIIDDNCRCPSKYSDEQVCIGTCAHMLMHYDIENEVLVPA
jgi:hypothetical protein